MKLWLSLVLCVLAVWQGAMLAVLHHQSHEITWLKAQVADVPEVLELQRQLEQLRKAQPK